MTDKDQKVTMTRRRFIRNSSLVAGGAAIGGGLIGALIGTNLDNDGKVKTSHETGHNQQENSEASTRALIYFTDREDFQVLSAATERIFPEDENGPGAIGLGVPYYIDHQLAGNYGNSTREYMQGPFFPGTETQGYQSPLKRNQVFNEGIRMLKETSQKNYNKKFDELDGEQQDEILSQFEQGKVPLRGTDSNVFFSLLRSAVLEGAYSDPVYGGNANMEGWKMKNFPGHQASYLSQIEAKEFKKIKPQSLHVFHK
ncbi:MULTISPECIES: gluconate 2-dehydrogenase subunit 3 family protein [Bacillaceae]|uniref:Dehydrogenase n=1 Tax=Pseudobacillus wudalianchiensis TaxID=1743143 RepID=A0A1B9ADU6_9BACI|nr:MULTISPECIES: gluconate 2-dehydrogenase subunit 3 family protein [Bacillus]KMY53965.1 dehydrogenase [Bacillus sp. FJAT-27231]OCA82016.1 dehydrogenase [Bacillus wudalianchiensis]